MRQSMNAKNVRRIAKLTGLPIVAILVRGGTDHRKDLCLSDGSVVHLWSDGTTEKSSIKHRYKLKEHSQPKRSTTDE